MDSNKGKPSGQHIDTQIDGGSVLDVDVPIPKGKHPGKEKDEGVYENIAVVYVNDPTKIIHARFQITLEPKDLYG